MTTMMELDHLDQLASSAFQGYIVRKDLVRKYARQYPVPTYVVEFLLGRYCASTDPDEISEGLEIVERQLEGRTVRTGHEELFKSQAREKGSVKLIDTLVSLSPVTSRHQSSSPASWKLCVIRMDPSPFGSGPLGIGVACSWVSSSSYSSGAA